MPVTINYTNLTDKEYKAIEFVINKQKNIIGDSEPVETVEEYCIRIAPNQHAINNYIQQMDAADAAIWQPFYDVCRALSTESRTTIAMQVVSLAQAEGINLEPLQPLIKKLSS